MKAYNLRLNPKRFIFKVDGGKFLGFMLSHRGIEANSKKCQVVIDMRSPKNVKEVQQLVGILTIISQLVL